MSMYIWKVRLEVEWKQTWMEGKKQKSDFWTEDDKEYTVAASSGREAIIKAEKLAMAQEPWSGEHYLEDDTTVPSKETPHRGLDVLSLSLKETLDG